MVNTMKNTGQNGSVHHRFVEAQRRRTEDCHVALDAVIAYLFADSEKGKIDLLRTILGCVVRSQPFHEWCLIDRRAVVRHYSCYMSSRNIVSLLNDFTDGGGERLDATSAQVLYSCEADRKSNSDTSQLVGVLRVSLFAPSCRSPL